MCGDGAEHPLMHTGTRTHTYIDMCVWQNVLNSSIEKREKKESNGSSLTRCNSSTSATNSMVYDTFPIEFLLLGFLSLPEHVLCLCINVLVPEFDAKNERR